MKNILKSTLMTLSLVALLPNAMAEGDVAAGEAIANSAGCAACHGADGNSPAPNFPKLAGLGDKYLFKQLKDIQAWDNAPEDEKEKTGRAVNEMIGLLKKLSDTDLKNLAAFYNSKPLQLAGAKDLKVLVNAGIKVDGLKLGERVYRAGNHDTQVAACIGCHSPTGQGNSPSGIPRIGGQHAQYIEAQLRAFRAGERINDGEASTMRQVAERMSDAEIKAVSEYIAGLN